VPTPTTGLATIRYLLTLPGWLTLYFESNHTPIDNEDAVEPDVSTADIVGAAWSGHGYGLTVWRNPKTAAMECAIRVDGGTPPEVRDNGRYWPYSGAEEIDKAVMWAIRTRALIEHVATTTLAAAAPPPPPTTIAELATRPGWRLDDGDAIHDGAKIIAEPNRVDLGLGDVVSCLDEQEAAEIAFAVAEITARAQARYAAANPDQE
jgi:hypothetical protein